MIPRLLDRPQDRFTLLDIRRHRFLGQHPNSPFEGGDDVSVVCGVDGGYYQDFDLLVGEHLFEGVEGVFGGGLDATDQSIAHQQVLRSGSTEARSSDEIKRYTYGLSELLQQLVVIPHPSLVDITESDDLVRRVVLYPVDDSPEEELATGAASDLVRGKWRLYRGAVAG
jgi:hypothetical protein